MIKSIGASNNLNFRADKNTIDAKSGEYVDPLMKWPMRGAAFTNEVGEALRPLIGNYATLSWAPALMYIGADVYDKYKNDQTEYSPNSRRCLKEAIFQGLASVALPVVAVNLGQTAFAQFGRLTNDKISYNTNDHISNLADNFVANGKMSKFDGKDEECINEFVSQVSSNMDYKNKKSPLKKFLNKILGDKKVNVENHARKTMEDLIHLRKDLKNPTTEVKAGKWYAKYINALQAGQTENVAIKSVLTNYQKGKLMKGNMIKTLGGFCALGMAISPIDHFVENVLIGKYVGPKIDNFRGRNK